MTHKIVVFGATGFVGNAICKAAVARGMTVVGLSRRQYPDKAVMSTGWATAVDWRKADALQPATLTESMTGAHAVVCCVGSPPTPTIAQSATAAQMEANGRTICNIADAAQGAHVPRLVLIGASMPPFTPQGYLKGKQMAEVRAREYAANDGMSAAVLKPGVIYGTRYAMGVPLPLWVVFQPVSFLMKSFPGPFDFLSHKVPVLEKALVPPLDVDQVARCATHFCDVDATQNEFVSNDPGNNAHGDSAFLELSVHDILHHAAHTLQ